MQQVTNTGNVTNNVIHADAGLKTTWSNGSLNLALPFSANNRSFNFISNGDGTTVPITNGVQINVQPDLPLQLMRTTENGNNYLEIDDYTFLASNSAFGIGTAGGLTNAYFDESGFGLSTDNANKSYFRTDNLSENRFLQVPDASGTIAVMGNINLQDILSAGGEAHLGSFPNSAYMNISTTGSYLQNQATHMFEPENYVSNFFGMSNDGLNIKYNKGNIGTTTQITESEIKLNDNGFGFKTNMSNNHAYFRTDNLTGIGDKTYQLPDIDGATLLTTKGTTSTVPLEGNLHFADGERDYEIYNTNTEELNYRGSLFFGGSGISLTAQTIEENSIMQLQPGGLTLTFSNSNSRGIMGQEDYSSNIMETDYTQKVYVDKNRLKEYIVSTLPAGTLGDTALVTDASSPAYLVTVVGGGSVKCPVFFNGTNWVAH